MKSCFFHKLSPISAIGLVKDERHSMLCEFQVQTRSADEPMTTFVFCNQCGNRWKVSPSISQCLNFKRNLPLWLECSHFSIVSFPQFC